MVTSAEMVQTSRFKDERDIISINTQGADLNFLDVGIFCDSVAAEESARRRFQKQISML